MRMLCLHLPITLEPDARLPTLRAAFKRAKQRAGADAVNLVTVGGDL